MLRRFAVNTHALVSHRHRSKLHDVTRIYSHFSTQPPASSHARVADVLVFADGASRGNPGKGGCGAVLMDAATNSVLATRTAYLGDRETNNTAEYHGLLLALQLAQSHAAARVHVHMDSELIVRQMTGVYRVKAPHLRVLYSECRALCDDAFENVTFSHVRREANAVADQLANDAIDTHEQLQMQMQMQKQNAAVE